MSEQKPTDRLAYSGDLEPVIDRLCEAYGVGTPANSSVVEVGYEDCNVVVETNQDKYLAKMFAKTRTAEEIARYTTTMQKVIEAGVHHPELLTTNSGEIAYTDSGITLVLMRFVEGETFFELDQAPDAEERKAVLEQAAKVNGIDYKPTYLFDSWAIPNIRAMFDKVRQFIEPKKTIDSYRVEHNQFHNCRGTKIQYLIIDVHSDPNTSQELKDAIATLYPVAYKPYISVI